MAVVAAEVMVRVEIRFTVTVVGTDCVDVWVRVETMFREIVRVTSSPLIVVVCGCGTDVIVVVRRSVRVVC